MVISYQDQGRTIHLDASPYPLIDLIDSICVPKKKTNTQTLKYSVDGGMGASPLIILYFSKVQAKRCRGQSLCTSESPIIPW